MGTGDPKKIYEVPEPNHPKTKKRDLIGKNLAEGTKEKRVLSGRVLGGHQSLHGIFKPEIHLDETGRRWRSVQVKITIVTSARSPRCKEGTYWYRLECDKAHREGTGTLTETTAHRLELFGLIEALKRMTRPSSLKIRTTSGYLQMGHRQLKEWKENGWSRPGGKEIKNCDLWEKVAELERGHQIEIEVVKSGEK